LRAKTFMATKWTHIALNVSDEAGRRMFKFCQAQVGKPFNKWGFYRCLTPFPRPTDECCWFCSELAITAFQCGGFLGGVIPSTCTPTALFHMLRTGHFNIHVSANPNIERRIVAGGGLSSSRALAHNLSLIRSWSRHVESVV